MTILHSVLIKSHTSPLTVQSRGLSAVLQYDIHTPELTVTETFNFAARCQGAGLKGGAAPVHHRAPHPCMLHASSHPGIICEKRCRQPKGCSQSHCIAPWHAALGIGMVLCFLLWIMQPTHAPRLGRGNKASNASYLVSQGFAACALFKYSMAFMPLLHENGT